MKQIHNTLAFIKLCDIYYKKNEKSIVLDDGEIVFLTEDQIILTKQDNLQVLSDLNYLKIVKKYDDVYLLELNFKQRESIYKKYLFDVLLNDNRFKYKNDVLEINGVKIEIKTKKENCSLTLIGLDNIRKRDLDLPRKIYFLLSMSDESYHFEKGLIAWIIMQVIDLNSFEEKSNFKEIDLIEAILQDNSYLNVKTKQDLNVSLESQNQVLLDIDKENHLIIEYKGVIRTIQLPNNTEHLQDKPDKILSLQLLVNFLIKDLY
ncbi:MAG: hypothetical protein COB02_17440 [Candidatus Cloacimonadota bacterium]|nr:MAG: hypothetical protein COB02_17440 [Candidatus Cloacimonadota bacterium]